MLKLFSNQYNKKWYVFKHCFLDEVSKMDLTWEIYLSKELHYPGLQTSNW